MKKLLQINPVLRVSTSTGRIMQEIGELALQNGWESYIAYGKGRDGIKTLQIGDYSCWRYIQHSMAWRSDAFV